MSGFSQEPFSGSNSGNRLFERLQRGSIKRRWDAGEPVVTRAIIAVCVIVWLVEEALYFFNHAQFLSLIFLGAFSPQGFLAQPWTALTSAFLHAPSIWHIVFNMLTLWVVGRVLEHIFGHWAYLALYLLSALGGSWGMVVWARITGGSAWNVSAYGASGAIFGLIGLLLVAYIHRHIDVRSIIVLLVISLFVPLLYANVAWQAHAGGFLVGLIATALIAEPIPGLKDLRYPTRVAVVCAVLAVAIVASMVWMCGDAAGAMTVTSA